jgi:pyruvate/2-oxoglutarate dehydrogenase complex dihydrolipoamide dehydrogenase (E3) component/uncharacterized membrane protein YdjX (TVP38/TMEM64 family)
METAVRNKIPVLVLIVLVIAAYVVFDLGRFLDFGYLQSQREGLIASAAAQPLIIAAIYFAIYIAVTALSLPGAAVLTLAGGAIFGFWQGLLLVSFASSIGATLAFLISRSLLRDWVQERFGESLKNINQGVEKDGAFYLFSLRLVPLFPFFVINLVMGLTPLKTATFYWVSQLGMLLGTAVYVNAGTQLGQLTSLQGIVSPALLGSFVLLGIFPWLGKTVMASLKKRRVLKKFNKPKQFDNNLIVIGAGAAGLVTSYIAAAVKAKVALIEKHKMGGDCLNTGCVPSKAILRSARIASYARRANEFGLSIDNLQVNFSAVMQRVHRVIKTIEPHDSVERYTALGVNCVQGEAKIISPWEVEVDGKILSARHIVIATGGRPTLPAIPGIENIDVLTSENLWSITELPKRLLVIGGGPIGCELSQAFAHLGSQVTQVIRTRLLPKEDPEVAELVAEGLRRDGVELMIGCEFVRFDTPNSLIVRIKDKEQVIAFDQVLSATGRKANTDNLGLEKFGIDVNHDGTVQVDDNLRTACPTIFACGDVAGPYQFTHAAAHQAWYAAVNALFGSFKSFKVDYRVLPWVTFTDPEIARVGLNEADAKNKNIAYEITRYDLDDLDRAIADGERHGFVKVITAKGSDKILGVTIAGYRAGEMLAEYVLAMKYGLGLNKILGTIHSYPTMVEANKYAAGLWKQANKPEKLLSFVERFHRWMIL